MLARQVRIVEDVAAPASDALQGVLNDLLAATGSRWGRLSFEKDGTAAVLAANFGASGRRAEGLIDPWRAGRPRVLGRAIRSESFLPSAVWRRSEHYLFAMRPTGVEPDHSLVASIDCAGGELVVFLARGAWERPYSTEEQARTEMFLPVLPRIAELHWRVEDEHRASAGKDAALDALSLGLLVTDSTGLVHYGNQASALPPGASDILRVEDGRITTVDPAHQADFHRAFAQASDPGAPMPSLISFTVANGVSATLLLSPLKAGASAGGASVAGQVLITLRTSGDQEGQLHAIRQLFGLSAAEAYLAWAMAHGHALADVAVARSVSVNTVRVQLTSLFRKTRTNRQAELVALINAIPPVRLTPTRPGPQRSPDRDAL